MTAFLAAAESLRLLAAGAAIYVDPATGSDTNGGGADAPKETIAAAVDAIAALDSSDPCTIFLAPGIHRVNRKNGIELSLPISVVGMGRHPSDVIVTNTSPTAIEGSKRLFLLDNAGAVVSGLTMTGGVINWAEGSAFRINAAGGMVTNCIVENCQGNNGHSRAAAFLSSGLVTHTLFRDIRLNAVAKDKDLVLVLDLCGGSAENCLITGIDTDKSVVLARVNSASSSMRNCTIAACVISGDGAGTREDGTPFTTTCSPLYISSGGAAAVQNCVAAGVTDGNGNSLHAFGHHDTIMAAMGNCAFDAEPSVSPNGTAVAPAEALFADFPGRDFRPRIRGPLHNAGATYGGMAAVDFAGRPRVIGNHIDIGCYELPPLHSQMTLR